MHTDAEILVQEWREDTANIQFPFTDSATITATSGTKLSSRAIVDAALYPPGYVGKLFLGRVVATIESVTYVLTNERGVTVATGTRTNDEIWFSDSLGRCAGVVVADPAELPQNWPIGTHTFGTTAEFVPTVIEQGTDTAVTSLVLPSGELMTGDVWLVGDDGVVFTRAGDGTIQVNMVGDPLFRRRLCDPVLNSHASISTPFFTKTYLQSLAIPVNGDWVEVPADQYGGFVISANDSTSPDSVLRIYPTDSGAIKVELVGKNITQA